MILTTLLHFYNANAETSYSVTQNSAIVKSPFREFFYGQGTQYLNILTRVVKKCHS